MPIKKTLISATHGVPVSAHKVTGIQHDMSNKSSIVFVASYFDENALQSNKAAISHVSILVMEEPNNNEANLAFAERMLIVPRPSGVPTAADIAKIVGGVDRYMFEGGVLID